MPVFISADVSDVPSTQPRACTHFASGGERPSVSRVCCNAVKYEIRRVDRLHRGRSSSTRRGIVINWRNVRADPMKLMVIPLALFCLVACSSNIGFIIELRARKKERCNNVLCPCFVFIYYTRGLVQKASVQFKKRITNYSSEYPLFVLLLQIALLGMVDTFSRKVSRKQ